MCLPIELMEHGDHDYQKDDEGFSLHTITHGVAAAFVPILCYSPLLAASAACSYFFLNRCISAKYADTEPEPAPALVNLPTPTITWSRPPTHCLSLNTRTI